MNKRNNKCNTRRFHNDYINAYRMVGKNKKKKKRWKYKERLC